MPDFLIYDEMKRRRERDAWQRERLELPLYRPETPRAPPENDSERRYEDPSPRREDTPRRDERGEGEEQERDRGVMIIDMNDLLGEESEEPEEPEQEGSSG